MSSTITYCKQHLSGAAEFLGAVVLRLSLWLGLMLPLFWPSGEAIASPLALSIDQVRQQSEGIEVLMTGVVIVSSGQFASATFDQGFAIQDEAGGIYVSSDDDTDLHIGDVVEVVGTLQDDGHGQRMVRLQSWQRQSAQFAERAERVPRPASLREAATQLDGQLVVVQGTIVQPLVDDAPYGDRLWIQDATSTVQIYIPRSTNIAPQTLSFLQPGRAVEVVGFSSQYDGNDEVIPRKLGDMRPLGINPRLRGDSTH
ncbi:MAG: hypothetical protein AAFW75_05505 [Cyanobacteria bacterium J06636_16]